MFSRLGSKLDTIIRNGVAKHKPYLDSWNSLKQEDKELYGFFFGGTILGSFGMYKSLQFVNYEFKNRKPFEKTSWQVIGSFLGFGISCIVGGIAGQYVFTSKTVAVVSGVGTVAVSGLYQWNKYQYQKQKPRKYYDDDHY